MPLSEFMSMVKGKVDATQQKASHHSTDLSHGGDNGCFELVWQNGQIMMQGNSRRARRGPISNDFPTFITKPRDGKDSKDSNMAKFGTMDSVLNDFPLSAPSCETRLDQDDNTVPWMNYSMVEHFSNEYCSVFLPELGVSRNELSAENNLASMEKRSSSNHVTEFDHSRTAANAMSIHQGSTSTGPSTVTEHNKLRISDTSHSTQIHYTVPISGNSENAQSYAGNANHVDSRNSACCSLPVGGSMGSKLRKLDVGQPTDSSGSLNFADFSRFAPVSRVNQQNTASTAGAVVSSRRRVGDGNKQTTMNSHNPLISCSHLESGCHAEFSVTPSAQDIESLTPIPDLLPPQQSEAMCLKDSKNNKSLDQPFDAVPSNVVVDDEKTPEPVVATSSVCSGNSLERASNNPPRSLKRKCAETGDSEGLTDEAEEESVGLRKTAPGCTGSKRSRAAEVHNLSERRRRERINEKMRALQELIPNCNKADKASMLDEAIEYLKTLQLQMQILSMGSGIYMPPMMSPAAVQEMHGTYMPQFLPMGIGMGMGIGFGMGLHDVNYSMKQMPNIQGPWYPVPGPPNSASTFHGAIGSHQGLGHPNQELFMPTPRVALPLLGSPPVRLPVGNVSAMPRVVDLPLLVPSASSKEMVQNVGSRDTQ